jgi:hypothetical protein
MKTDAEIFDTFERGIMQSENNHPLRLIGSMLYHTPRAPAGWRAPGPFELDDDQRKEIHFYLLARGVWKAGKGYLIPWMWDIYEMQKYSLGPYEREKHRRARAKERERWTIPDDLNLPPEIEAEKKKHSVGPVPDATADALLAEIADGRVMSGSEGHMGNHTRCLVNLPLWAVKAAALHAGHAWPKESE